VNCRLTSHERGLVLLGMKGLVGLGVKGLRVNLRINPGLTRVNLRVNPGLTLNP